MDNNWLFEDINLYQVLSKNFLNATIAGAYTKYSENVYKENSFYTNGSYTAYFNYHGDDSYGKYGNYTKYKVYSDYGVYSKYTKYSRCGYQCQVNQYLKHYIGTFDVDLTSLLVLASTYNAYVDYIKRGVTYINNLVTNNNLSSTYRITDTTQKVTALSDVYYADNFNKLNATINRFIDGVTNILDKNPNLDQITKTELTSFVTTINNFKIPPTTPRED